MTATLKPLGVPGSEMIELTHPGEMLREDFLEPLSLIAHELAQAIGVSQALVSEILRGQHDIDAEMSLLLDKFFGLSDGYWLRLQADYDFRKARRALAEKLTRVHPYAELQGTRA